MTRLFASDPHCKYVTAPSGQRYNNDRRGFVHVDSAKDVRDLKAGGYVVAGSTPHTSRVWVCECGWEALINSCPRCERTDLTKVDA